MAAQAELLSVRRYSERRFCWLPTALLDSSINNDIHFVLGAFLLASWLVWPRRFEPKLRPFGKQIVSPRETHL